MKLRFLSPSSVLIDDCIQTVSEFKNLYPDVIVIGTHPGTFHPDDTCAIATLLLIFPDAVVVRTRDKTELASCDYRVDVGEKYCPQTGDFDHHQEGGAGHRTNHIEYSSFGLVWAKFGVRITGNIYVARYIDKAFVQTIDALDNGQALAIPNEEFQGAKPYDISNVLSIFNLYWDEEADPDDRFMEVVELAMKIIKRLIGRTVAGNKAHPFVMQAIAKAKDPRIIILDRFYPWKNTVGKNAPLALFIIFPNNEDRWCVQAIGVGLGNFENRLNLPADWAKNNGYSFADITGIADAEFIHRKLFICTARSFEGALKLANLALEQKLPDPQ
jgi:uncharacterized UPF0160 family protein